MESPAPGPGGNMGYHRESKDPAERQPQGDQHHPHDLHRHTSFARGQDSTSCACMRARARRCNREMCIWE